MDGYLEWLLTSTRLICLAKLVKLVCLSRPDFVRLKFSLRGLRPGLATTAVVRGCPLPVLSQPSLPGALIARLPGLLLSVCTIACWRKLVGANLFKSSFPASDFLSIVFNCGDGGVFCLGARGDLRGIFLNGERVSTRESRDVDGDAIVRWSVNVEAWLVDGVHWMEAFLHTGGFGTGGASDTFCSCDVLNCLEKI